MLERENNVLSGKNSADYGTDILGMGLIRTGSQNGPQLTSNKCTHMGAGGRKKEGSTVRDMVQNCGKGT